MTYEGVFFSLPFLIFVLVSMRDASDIRYGLKLPAFHIWLCCFCPILGSRNAGKCFAYRTVAFPSDLRLISAITLPDCCHELISSCDTFVTTVFGDRLKATKSRNWRAWPLPPEGSALSSWATGASKLVLQKTLKLRQRLRASLPDRTGEDSKGPSFSTF